MLLVVVEDSVDKPLDDEAAAPSRNTVDTDEVFG
jgi:hypothetical protein